MDKKYLQNYFVGNKVYLMVIIYSC
jgi:hypothetical protein